MHRKIMLVKKYNFDIRLSFYDALKRISEIWYLSQNLEEIFGLIDQRIRDEIP